MGSEMCIRDRLGALLAPVNWTIPVISLVSLIMLAILGGSAAYTGGASLIKGSVRVTFWGAFAMGLTAGVGYVFGVIA